MPDELVVTPGGYRPKSMVTAVEPGNILRMSAGRLQKVSPAGIVLHDAGIVAARTTFGPLMPANVFKLPVPPAAPSPAGAAAAPALVPALGGGWISYAYWNNGTGHPITSFRTTWLVPPAPATHSGVVFLFNGIQNNTMIYQPVLQYGVSAAGGGNYWAVASWYADGQGGPAFHSQLTRVNPGDVLVGVMTLAGQSGNLFSYNCSFTGIANSSLPIQNVQELKWCCETLEVYSLNQATDYPATQYTAFRGIAIQTGSVTPALAWTADNAVTDCGQKCVVVSNSAVNGEVDIYYGKGSNIAVALAEAVNVGSNADGRMEIVVTGTDHALWHLWQTAPSNGWSNWASLGGVLTSVPEFGRNLDGRLEIFARGTDDAVWHNWQTAPNNGWSGWASMGGVITSDVAVGKNKDGRMEVFARGTDGALWHIWQVAPNSGWSPWASLGGVITSDPVVTQNQDGRIEVFARGTDNALWHIWQVAPGGAWSSWGSLGGSITSVATAGMNADGRLEVFARGTDNAAWHIWQTTPNGGWSGWASLGGVITSDPVLARNADGRLELFARGTDNALWHIWQTAPSNGWSHWASLGGVITSDPTIGRNADGRMEVFARGTDNALWHIWQTAPSNGWSTWGSLGGIITADLAATA